MPKAADPRAAELARLDKATSETSGQAWTMFVSLLLDEALQIAADLGHADDLDFAVTYYFDMQNVTKLFMAGHTYYRQINPRTDWSRHLEPFGSYLNQELKKRGSSIQFRPENGWYSAFFERV